MDEWQDSVYCRYCEETFDYKENRHELIRVPLYDIAIWMCVTCNKKRMEYTRSFIAA